ncbi:MAG: leucine-rich repeat domain-containing protein [Cytophagaceae bacterium]|jgi:putative transposon-encoded protein|nr:leucine-rich repeat domain-containing protein [Cytophagaceae bacterium]
MRKFYCGKLIQSPENDTKADFKWSFFDGILMVTGDGSMPDYNTDTEPPYAFLADSINEVVIGERITRIGNNAFHLCKKLNRVIFQNTVTSIGNNAFFDHNNTISIVTI